MGIVNKSNDYVMNIFFASDNKYVQHLAVAITSILENSNEFENFNFFIMDGGISVENKENINKVKK